jgi:hypothetical protein
MRSRICPPTSSHSMVTQFSACLSRRPTPQTTRATAAPRNHAHPLRLVNPLVPGLHNSACADSRVCLDQERRRHNRSAQCAPRRVPGRATVQAATHAWTTPCYVASPGTVDARLALFALMDVERFGGSLGTRSRKQTGRHSLKEPSIIDIGGAGLADPKTCRQKGLQRRDIGAAGTREELPGDPARSGPCGSLSSRVTPIFIADHTSRVKSTCADARLDAAPPSITRCAAPQRGRFLACQGGVKGLVHGVMKCGFPFMNPDRSIRIPLHLHS